MADIRTQSLKEPVDVGDYLFTRLHQVGVRSVHGLPGDYNLVACDYVPKCGLTWVGNANELNAGMLRPPFYHNPFLRACSGQTTDEATSQLTPPTATRASTASRPS